MPPLGGIPSEFLDETYPAKTRGMGLLYGENCTLLTNFNRFRLIHPRDGQTDGQTELWWHICAVAYMLLRVKTVQIFQLFSVEA